MREWNLTSQSPKQATGSPAGRPSPDTSRESTAALIAKWLSVPDEDLRRIIVEDTMLALRKTVPDPVIVSWATESASLSHIPPMDRIHHIMLELSVLAKLCWSLQMRVAGAYLFHQSLFLAIRLEVHHGHSELGYMIGTHDIVLDAAIICAQTYAHPQQKAALREHLSEARLNEEFIMVRSMLQQDRLSPLLWPPNTDRRRRNLEDAVCALFADDRTWRHPSIYALLMQIEHEASFPPRRFSDAHISASEHHFSAHHTLENTMALLQYASHILVDFSYQPGAADASQARLLSLLTINWFGEHSPRKLFECQGQDHSIAFALLPAFLKCWTWVCNDTTPYHLSVGQDRIVATANTMHPVLWSDVQDELGRAPFQPQSPEVLPSHIREVRYLISSGKIVAAAEEDFQFRLALSFRRRKEHAGVSQGLQIDDDVNIISHVPPQTERQEAFVPEEHLLASTESDGSPRPQIDDQRTSSHGSAETRRQESFFTPEDLQTSSEPQPILDATAEDSVRASVISVRYRVDSSFFSAERHSGASSFRSTALRAARRMSKNCVSIGSRFSDLTRSSTYSFSRITGYPRNSLPGGDDVDMTDVGDDNTF